MSLLTHLLLKGYIKRNDIIVLSRCSGSTEHQLFTEFSFRRSKLVSLLALSINTGKHHIHSCDSMRYSFSALSQNLCRDRNNIHDGISPSIMISRLYNLNTNVVDSIIFLQKGWNNFLRYDHLAIVRYMVVLTHLNAIHMKCLDDKSSQINFLYTHLHTSIL